MKLDKEDTIESVARKLHKEIACNYGAPFNAQSYWEDLSPKDRAWYRKTAKEIFEEQNLKLSG